jgi:phosphonate transport system substrate-binding protein
MAFGDTPRPLVIGVIPYLSPSVLLNLFAPVRDHLQKALGRPVVLYTATDVPTYVRRCLNDEYDLQLSSAHFTRLVQRRRATIPLTVSVTAYTAWFMSAGVRALIRSASSKPGGLH